MATGSTFHLEIAFGDASFSAEGEAKQVMAAYEIFRKDALEGGALPDVSAKTPRKPRVEEPEKKLETDAAGTPSPCS